MEIIYGHTYDELKLMGCLWNTVSKETCVVFVHGMCEDIIVNYYATVWGKILSEHNIGFLYGHNRGYSHINDIETKSGGNVRIGTTYETFAESEYDIDLWVDKAKELGYKKIILLGHSLGCNKAIYYLYKKDNVVDGLILASPPDLRGKLQLSEKDYYKLIEEALKNIKDGNPRKLLSKKIYNYYTFSSKTFIDFYSEESFCNNLPIKDKKKVFVQLSKINIPILAFSGENEHYLYHQLDFIKSKATSCKSFDIKIFENTDHFYKNDETEIGNYIVDWIKDVL